MLRACACKTQMHEQICYRNGSKLLRPATMPLSPCPPTHSTFYFLSINFQERERVLLRSDRPPLLQQYPLAAPLVLAYLQKCIEKVKLVSSMSSSLAAKTDLSCPISPCSLFPGIQCLLRYVKKYWTINDSGHRDSLP